MKPDEQAAAAAAAGDAGRWRVREVSLPALSEAEAREYLDFGNRLLAVSHPGDPPRTLEDQTASWNHLPASVETHEWEARDAERGGALAGRAGLQILHQKGDANAAMASLILRVLPEYRRAGAATALLRPVLDRACARGRTNLMAVTDEATPAGERFLERLGARPGLRSHVHQLDLADVDEDALRAYRESSAARAAGDGVALAACDSPAPEEWLGRLADLSNALTVDVPMGDLSIEPIRFTAEQIAEFDRARGATGAVTLRLVAVAPGGEPVGLTEVTWRRSAPHLAVQGITGVLPAWRGRGLARWLKSAMLERLRAELPGLRFVRTENADQNAGIRAINRGLGFRPYRSETVWEVTTDAIAAYLAGRGG